jgi:hypothetical protein
LNASINLENLGTNRELSNRYIGTWMPDSLVKEIDKVKGDISRNLFIKRTVIKALRVL